MKNFFTALWTEPATFGLLVSWCLSLVAVVANYLAKRKRISSLMLYNGKFGLLPPLDKDEGNPWVRNWLRSLEHVSIFALDVTNSGRAEIDSDNDYNEPLRISFPGRYILDYRISEPIPKGLRAQVEADSYVSRIPENRAVQPDSGVTQARLRSDLERAMQTGGAAGLTKDEISERQQLNLALKTSLIRREGFKLLIDLKEREVRPARELDKAYNVDGSRLLRRGRFTDASSRSRQAGPLTYSLGLVTAALTVALLGAGLLIGLRQPSFCGSGVIQIKGSTAFAPTMQEIADKYQASCRSARIEIQAHGTQEGIGAVLNASPEQRASIATMSDGASNEPELSGLDVAATFFSLAVHSEVGVTNLTTEQIRQIYSGEITDWQRVREGPSLPIKIVGRGAESGTRKAFEGYVLGEGRREPQFNAYSCARPDRSTIQAGTEAIIVCEKSSTSEVLSEIGREAGAIGYADTRAISQAERVQPVSINGNPAFSDFATKGYGFWTIEYFYTNGEPPADSLMAKFRSYLSGPDARNIMAGGQSGDTLAPCRTDSGSVEQLCRLQR